MLADRHYTLRTPLDRAFRLNAQERQIWEECDTAIRNHYTSMDGANFGAITRSQELASSLHAFNRTKPDFRSPHYDARIPDSKFNELLALVEERREKMVVFSRFMATVD
ncbi:hypothetical protein RZS08_45650, partial [Arthrospira platensis SPKY1]|nr:hypothetical protein [Arthrospira platensis SPKY1]